MANDSKKPEDDSFARTLRLYLDPFALAKEATGTDRFGRLKAVVENRWLRRHMPVYGLRWSVIGALSMAGVRVAEAGLKVVGGEWMVPLVLSGIGVAISSVVLVVVVVAWFYLGR